MTNVNKDQSNLVKGGITCHLYSLGGSSSNLQLHVLPEGLTSKISHSHVRQGPPSDTKCEWTPRVYVANRSKSVEWFKHGARM